MTRVEKDVQQLFQRCTFTKDQYDHILHIFEKRTESTTDSNNAHLAGNVFFVFENNDVWIIDTGATNHMVSSLDILTDESVTKLKIPKSMYHPNGKVTHVTHVCSCALSARSVITDVFHIPNFKCNLMSVKSQKN